MSSQKSDKRIDELFQWSVIAKGAFALVETLTGLVVLFVPLERLTGWVASIATVALEEDPDSFIASHSLKLAQSIPERGHLFIAAYLLSRGLIKLLLVVGLLRGKLWAYPASLAVLGFFMIYQTYEVFVNHSIPLLLLTLFDFVVMYLIWREYKLVQARVAAKSQQA